MKSAEQLTEAFRARGHKVTPQRQCIVDALVRTSGQHPTAEAIHAEVVEQLPMVSLKTVYQTLNDLAGMGELGHLDLGTGSARFDTNTDQHQHLVCVGCGRVWDVYADFTEVRIPSEYTGEFQVSSTDIVFRGQCRHCAAAGDPGAPPPSAM